ncbi:VOC family protein [Paenibacillus harenae]|uniref:Glyoxalase family protein n=1 Tax=Paenibacillus harenae TaxID=306543 RepID=A0ABT9UAF7_PAEHA|nr:VOC family protein [Paenibacillus harenae]MDQ0116247.1 glyoxalase family protein [Paenibacillus harenae]
MKPIIGQHHVSMFTKDASTNVAFYTKVMGLRFVKKTVNQDNVSMYHLFYGDKVGSPGTGVTFFELPNAGHARKGTDSISSISLTVPSDEALDFWKARLEGNQAVVSRIIREDGRASLTFGDPDDLTVHLVSVQGAKPYPPSVAWVPVDIPAQYAILGLGPAVLTVRESAKTIDVLERILGYKKTRSAKALGDGTHEVSIFETGMGGLSTEIHVKESALEDKARPGRGSIHHVAVRIGNKEELEGWASRIAAEGFKNTGIIDRHFFTSFYFWDPNGIVFELATDDGPGYEVDDATDVLLEPLSLPPFLEERRSEIESKLHPIIEL